MVQILAFENVQLLDVAGPLQVFSSANDVSRLAGEPAPYQTEVISRQAGSVTSSAGLGLVTRPLPRASERADTLIVAGGPGIDEAAADAALVAWVRRHSARTRRVASVCTGAFLLAETGLLDGRRAATHWTRCAELARRFESVQVEADPIFVQDGPVWSSAGVTAGIDLALAFVEEDLGRSMALAVARHLVVFLKRPGGQSQFSATLALQDSEGDFDKLHQWIANHLDADLTLPVLAEKAAMSERTFSRRYMALTGLTPARAVERLRLEAARRQLSDTRKPIKRVAEHCGYGSEETMRRSFSKLLCVSPQEYRNRFGR